MSSLGPLLTSDVLLSFCHPRSGSLPFLKKNCVISFILQMMKLRHKGKRSAKCAGSAEENNPSLSFHPCFRLTRWLPAGGCLLLLSHSNRITWGYSFVISDLPFREKGRWEGRSITWRDQILLGSTSFFFLPLECKIYTSLCKYCYFSEEYIKGYLLKACMFWT